MEILAASRASPLVSSSAGPPQRPPSPQRRSIASPQNPRRPPAPSRSAASPRPPPSAAAPRPQRRLALTSLSTASLRPQCRSAASPNLDLPLRRRTGRSGSPRAAPLRITSGTAALCPGTSPGEGAAASCRRPWCGTRSGFRGRSSTLSSAYYWQMGFEVVDRIKEKLEAECSGTVSCADLIAIAARDAVVLNCLLEIMKVAMAGAKDALQ